MVPQVVACWVFAPKVIPAGVGRTESRDLKGWSPGEGRQRLELLLLPAEVPQAAWTRCLRWSLLAPENLLLLMEPTRPASMAVGRERCRQGEEQAGRCRCPGVPGGPVLQPGILMDHQKNEQKGSNYGGTPQTGISKAGQATTRPWSIFCSPAFARGSGGGGWGPLGTSQGHQPGREIVPRGNGVRRSAFFG